MTEILISINPFSGEVLIQKDGRNIPKTAKLAEYYKSFLKASKNLPDDLDNDYNETEANIVTETSDFESLFLSVLLGGKPDFQVVKRAFAINISLKERITALCALLEKYHKNTDMLSAMRKDITVFSEAEYGEKFKDSIEKEYPQLSKLGFFIQISQKPALCNILKDPSQIQNLKKNLAAVDGELYPVVFVVSSSNKIVYDDQLVIWYVTEDSLPAVLTAFFERYFLAPAISRIKKNFQVPGDAPDDLCQYAILDQIRETVIVPLPNEIEAGKSYEIKIHSFSSGAASEIRMESIYREILDIDKKDTSTFILRAVGVGDSDVKVFKNGELTPFLQKNIRVVNYGYATSVKILIDGKSVPNHVMTPGSSVSLSLRYEPEDSPKTLDDVQNAQWSVSNEQVGVFDKGKSQFIAKAPGIAKITVKLHRVQHEVVMVVKQSVSDFSIELLNKEHPHIEEIRTGGEHQSIEYVRCLIATGLEFKLNRFPAKAQKTNIILKASEGISVKKENDEEHFSISADRIGRGESLSISLQGTEIVKKIIFDVIPNEGTSGKDNTLSTYIGGALAGMLLLWFLVMWCSGFNVIILFVGVVAIAFDSIVLAGKLKTIPKLSAQEREKNKKLIAAMLALTVAAFLFSFVKRPSYTPRTPVRNYSAPVRQQPASQPASQPAAPVQQRVKPKARYVRPLNIRKLKNEDETYIRRRKAGSGTKGGTLQKNQEQSQTEKTKNLKPVRYLNVVNTSPDDSIDQTETYRTLKPIRSTPLE